MKRETLIKKNLKGLNKELREQIKFMNQLAKQGRFDEVVECMEEVQCIASCYTVAIEDGKVYKQAYENEEPQQQEQPQQEEPKQEDGKVKILATKNDHMNCYTVKTKGKHPVHMIEGGEYLTEDERYFRYDMGWFNLNEADYKYFKEHQETIETELENVNNSNWLAQ